MKSIVPGIQFGVHFNGMELPVGPHGLIDVGLLELGGSKVTLEIQFTPEETQFEGAGILDVITINGARDITVLEGNSEPKPGTYSYIQNIAVRPLKERAGHFTSHEDNAIMFVHITCTGIIRVWQVTVIIQKGKFYFALVRRTHCHQVYRFDGGTIQAPLLVERAGEHTKWPQLNKMACDWLALSENAGIVELPSIKEYVAPAPFDHTKLEPNEVYVQWSTARRQKSGGINNKGYGIGLSWKHVLNAPQGRPAELESGEIVQVGEFARPNSGSQLKGEGEQIRRPIFEQIVQACRTVRADAKE